MADKPSNVLQFEQPRQRYLYMGGTTIGCGDHPTAAKRHRWGPWMPVYSGRGRERSCKTCGLMSDVKWIKE